MLIQLQDALGVQFACRVPLKLFPVRTGWFTRHDPGPSIARRVVGRMPRLLQIGRLHRLVTTLLDKISGFFIEGGA